MQIIINISHGYAAEKHLRTMHHDLASITWNFDMSWKKSQIPLSTCLHKPVTEVSNCRRYWTRNSEIRTRTGESVNLVCGWPFHSPLCWEMLVERCSSRDSSSHVLSLCSLTPHLWWFLLSRSFYFYDVLSWETFPQWTFISLWHYMEISLDSMHLFILVT